LKTEEGKTITEINLYCKMIGIQRFLFTVFKAKLNVISIQQKCVTYDKLDNLHTAF